MKKKIEKICSDPGCDNIYWVLPQHFKRSVLCPECQRYKHRLYLNELQRKRRARKKEEEKKKKESIKKSKVINLIT